MPADRPIPLRARLRFGLLSLYGPRLAALLIVAALALSYGTVALAVAAAPPAPASGSELQTSDASASQKKKKKKKKKKAKTCVLKKQIASGKLITVRHRVYAYKFVRRGGRRVRTIVRKLVPMRGPCSKRCIVTKRLLTGQLRTVYVRKRIRVRVKRGKRLVYVRVRARTPKLRKCPKGLGPVLAENTPVTVVLLPGSVAILDFGSFQRRPELRGTLKGFSPGTNIDLSKQVTVIVNRGEITVERAPIFIDDLCGGETTAAVRIGPGTKATLDPTRESKGTFDPKTARVVAQGYVVVRATLELRNDDNGCNKPYITTGYTEFRVGITLRGKLGKFGLSRVEFSAPPELNTNVVACVSPGPPTSPCQLFAVPVPIGIGAHIVAKVTLKLGG